MNKPIQITVTPNLAGQRLDKLLAGELPDISRSRLKSLIQDGHVSCDNNSLIKGPSQIVKLGETYCVYQPEPVEAVPQAENIQLDITFEDEHLILVNKPAGMVVHPAAGNRTGTLVNALLHHCHGSLSGIGGVIRPGIVHRIDKDTSGLLVMAKHDKAHAGLSKQFADHSIHRIYSAICKGHPNPSKGRIEGNIARSTKDRKKMAVTDRSGKWAVTHYKTQIYFHKGATQIASHIECKLETGRTHQVRVHMNHIGHPLVGDQTYGNANKYPNSLSADLRGLLSSFPRQALHARELGFTHPITGTDHHFMAKLPTDMQVLLDGLMPYS